MDENPHVLAPYSCPDILFRALPYPELVRKSDGVHKHQCFMRRESDLQGVSLFTTIQACIDSFGNPIFGVRSVHVGTLRDYNLEVFPDSPIHGNIRYNTGENIPTKHQNQPLALQLADDLMDQSRPVAYWAEENADERFQQELQAKRADQNR